MDERSFITPGHTRARNILRIAGPIIFLLGLLFAVIAAIDLFTANGQPEWFWLGFVGLPLMFVGGVMCMYGFMGVMARYALTENAPPAKDTINYLAEGTQEGMTTTARAIATGVREGLGGQTTECPKCHVRNDSDAKFCKGCGAALR